MRYSLLGVAHPLWDNPFTNGRGSNEAVIANKANMWP